MIQTLTMENYQDTVCPICAVALIKEEHSLPNFSFKKKENKERLTDAIVYNQQQSIEGE